MDRIGEDPNLIVRNNSPFQWVSVADKGILPILAFQLPDGEKRNALV
jgi:hypothetical protein